MIHRAVLYSSGNGAERSLTEEAFRRGGFRILPDVSRDSVLLADAVIFVCTPESSGDAQFAEYMDLCLRRDIPCVALHREFLPDAYCDDDRILDAGKLSFRALHEAIGDPFVHEEVRPEQKRRLNRLYAFIAILLAVFSGFILWRLTPGLPAAEADTVRTEQQELLDAYGDSVVQVWSVGSFEASVYRGTGFVVRNDGYILTCAHVVDHPSSYYVVRWGSVTVPAEIVASLPQKDIALLKTARIFPHSLSFAGEGPGAGDAVFTIGYPEDSDQTAVTGTYEGTRFDTDDGRTFAVTRLALRHGNSGSPVCGMNGEVIGIASAVSLEYEDVSYIVPYDVCREFLIPYIFVK